MKSKLLLAACPFAAFILPAMAGPIATFDISNLAEDLASGWPASDWADNTLEPAFLTHQGGVYRVSNSTGGAYRGWSTSIDLTKYVGTTITPQPGHRLNLTHIDFQAAGTKGNFFYPLRFPTKEYVWGYRIDNGSGFGDWVMGTVTPVTDPNFSVDTLVKTWDFEDFSTSGKVEFGFFVAGPPYTENGVPNTAYDPTGRIRALTVNGTVDSLDPIQPLHTYTQVGNYDDHVSEGSGIAYNWDTDTLFVIGDEGEELVQISKQGEKINSMAFDYEVSPRELRGLDDPEGVAYLGNNTFMLADERDFYGRVTTFEAGARRTQADLAPTSYYFTLYGGNANIGLEGVAYDPVEKAVWGVKEFSPGTIFKMTGLPQLNANSTGVSVVQPIERRSVTRWYTDPKSAPVGVQQQSDIFALAASGAFPEGHPRRNHLLVLSRNSRKIIEITRTGVVMDVLDLGAIPALASNSSIEGLTMDNDGVLYMVSEAGGLHVLKSPAVPVYTPEQLRARDAYAQTLRSLGLDPDLAVSAPGLIAAIDDSRDAGGEEVVNNPENYNLYTEDSIQDLRGTGLLIQVEGESVNLKLPIERSTELETDSWEDIGYDLEATLPKTGGKAFYRLSLPE